MKKRHMLRIAVSVIVMALSSQVSASPEADLAAREMERALHLTPNVENGKNIYMTCAVCHGPEGWGRTDGYYPQISGQLNTVIIKQLADIRARNRDNPTMYPFALTSVMGGAQEIADVAAYISQLPMNRQNGFGPGSDLAHGEKLYKDNCVECHGDYGEGNDEKHLPLLQGQHFQYLLRQFEWIRTGKRRNADQKMIKQIQQFTPRDVIAVMDYVSRLRPRADKLSKPGWQNPDFQKYVRPPGMYHAPPGPGSYPSTGEPKKRSRRQDTSS